MSKLRPNLPAELLTDVNMDGDVIRSTRNQSSKSSAFIVTNSYGKHKSFVQLSVFHSQMWQLEDFHMDYSSENGHRWDIALCVLSCSVLLDKCLLKDVYMCIVKLHLRHSSGRYYGLLYSNEPVYGSFMPSDIT